MKQPKKDARKKRKRKPAAVCGHCAKPKPSHARGLCLACFHTPGVRARYECLVNYDSSAGGRDNAARRPAAEPTDARPGSEEKLRVLIEREARGEQLWHPRDNLGRAGRPAPCVADEARVEDDE